MFRNSVGRNVLAACLLVSFTACDSDADTAASGSGSPELTFAELLTWAAEPLEERWHFDFVSLAHLRELAAVPLPDDLEDADEVIAYRDALFEDGNLGISPVLYVVLGDHLWEDRQDQLLRHFSLSFAHIDATLFYGPPGGGTTVSLGRFDRDAADQALRACEECPLETEFFDHSGAEYYAWGGDRDQNLRARFAPPLLDGLGRGGRVYLTDRVAAHAFEHEEMQGLLDAGTGQGRSLMDIEGARLAVEALDELEVYTGFVSDIVYDVAYRELDLAIMTEFGEGPPTDAPWYPGPGEPSLVRYRIFGGGAGLTAAGEPTTSFVLVHDTAEQATTNADQLKRRLQESSSALYDQPWSELLADFEVNSDGRVVTATLVGPVTYSMVYSGDALLFFED